MCGVFYKKFRTAHKILSPVRLPVPPRQHNGTNRARTYDPLLVRQMLSQLSYDPKFYFVKLNTLRCVPVYENRNDPEGTRTLDLRRDRAAL